MFGRLFRANPQPVGMSAVCRDLVQSLDMAAGASSEHVRSHLHTVMTVFEASSSTQSEKSQLIKDLLDADMPVKMLEALPKLEFEAAKDSMRLFNQLLKLGTSPVSDYIRRNKQVLQLLLDGCGSPDVALQSNDMLRSCTKHAKLVEMLFEADFAVGLMNLAQHQDFDISSDAFCSLRELLMGCKPVAALYLRENSKAFFAAYHELLRSEDYFTKRQALGLIADVLVNPCFVDVVSSYVSNYRFLETNMNLLRDSSKAIQSDAVRVFDVFVTNSEASPRVHKILFKNKDRLVRLLDSMSSDDKENDDGFVQDLRAAVQALKVFDKIRSRTNSSNSVGSSVDEQSSHEKQAVLNDHTLDFTPWRLYA